MLISKVKYPAPKECSSETFNHMLHVMKPDDLEDTLLT